MTTELKNYGFVEPKMLSDHYVFGANDMPDTILRPDGQWLDCLPDDEPQSHGPFETFGCTVFGTLNAIEILMRFLTGEDWNFSDRFTYITSETYPPGNDPHLVAEAIRSAGLLNEDILPFSNDIDSLEKFISLGEDAQDLLALALKWLQAHDFKHEWVFYLDTPLKTKAALLMDELKRSPLGVSVRAWEINADGLYTKQPGAGDSHWCVLVGYQEGQYWLVFDTYAEDGTYLKKLIWGYDFGFAKRYYVANKPTSPIELEKPRLSFFQRVGAFIKGIFRSLGIIK